MAVEARKAQASVEQQIKSSDKQFELAFNRGDIEAIVPLYAEDALLMGPDAPPVQGGEAVLAGFKQLYQDAGWRNLRLSSVDMGTSEKFAYHVGKLAVDVPAGGGERRPVTGKFLDIYKPQKDGSWKIQITSFSFDEPLSE